MVVQCGYWKRWPTLLHINSVYSRLQRRDDNREETEQREEKLNKWLLFQSQWVIVFNNHDYNDQLRPQPLNQKPGFALVSLQLQLTFPLVCWLSTSCCLLMRKEQYQGMRYGLISNWCTLKSNSSGCIGLNVEETSMKSTQRHMVLFSMHPDV